MPTSPIKFKQEFEQLLIQFLWQEWSAIGVAGYAESRNPWIIDPEALLLFSTVIARKDPRLFDEILDWLQQNAGWINLQRVGSIRTEHALGDSHVLAAIATHLARSSEHNKWKTLCNQGSSKRRDLEKPRLEPTPLFPDAAHFGATDPDFLEWGFLRPPIEHRGLSQPPRCNQAPTFLFKLRSLFGRQSRAEIIAWLLSHESGAHPAEIARQTNYFRRSVQVVLNELKLSDLVHAVQRGREKHFTLRHSEWNFLRPQRPPEQLPTGFPIWLQWPLIFSVLQQFQQVLDSPKLESMSANLLAIRIRETVDLESLQTAGLLDAYPPAAHSTGHEFLEATFDLMRKILSEKNTTG